MNPTRPKPEGNARKLLNSVVANLGLCKCRRCGHYGNRSHICPECGYDDSRCVVDGCWQDADHSGLCKKHWKVRDTIVIREE